MTVGRYFHTLRHLRPIQFYGRLLQRMPKRVPRQRTAPPRRDPVCVLAALPERPPSLHGPDTFVFLNVTRRLEGPHSWNDQASGKLWLFNLHYFDDLVADRAGDREQWHRSLIERWIEDNPVGHGVGWEPYPLSMRIVNWIKWSLAGHELSPSAGASLATQIRLLTSRIEHHLLANHLWTNGKALLFAGAYFDGDEARRWRAQGLRIVTKQLREQVLADGGHYERSPMYHALFVADVIDMVALARCFPQLFEARIVADWRSAVPRMLEWLGDMTHPDGRLAQFNDSVEGVAPSPPQLRAAAAGLGMTVRHADAAPLTTHPESGYVRMTGGGFVLIADVGLVGPDYNPGHAHADTLSFEVSWRGVHVLGNSGTSGYTAGPQRDRERGTAAHNTVTVDSENSSEVWHAFRVARRARPIGLQTRCDAAECSVECAHDGYARLSGRPMHWRRWRLDAAGLEIEDRVTGTGHHDVAGRYHVQPGIDVQRVDRGAFRLAVPGAGQLILRAAGDIDLELEIGESAPEFGIVRPRPVISWRSCAALPIRTVVRLEPVPGG